MKNAQILILLLVVLQTGCRTAITPQTKMLQDAALIGNLAAVEQSFDKGADIAAKDERGWTPLIRAVSGKHIEVIKFLLANGADVNARTEIGATPLMAAVALGNMEIITLLLDSGADINAEAMNGDTPLRIAIIRKHDHVAGFLISQGASL